MVFSELYTFVVRQKLYNNILEFKNFYFGVNYSIPIFIGIEAIQIQFQFL